jgi:hypothetical protein
MIDGIRIDARDQIEPTFRVPAVRVDFGYMDLLGTILTTIYRGHWAVWPRNWPPCGRAADLGGRSCPAVSGLADQAGC